jgi:hypothetical protein
MYILYYKQRPEPVDVQLHARLGASSNWVTSFTTINTFAFLLQGGKIEGKVVPLLN